MQTCLMYVLVSFSLLCPRLRPPIDVKEVFDLFDFWDGRDGMVDAAKIGDFLRCCNLNPTNAIVLANGGVEKMGSSIAARCCC